MLISDMVFDKEKVDQKLRNLAQKMQSRYKDLSNYDVERKILQLDRLRERLQPLVVDEVSLMINAQADREKVLIKGANALMLDVSSTLPSINIFSHLLDCPWYISLCNILLHTFAWLPYRPWWPSPQHYHPSNWHCKSLHHPRG